MRRSVSALWSDQLVDRLADRVVQVAHDRVGREAPGLAASCASMMRAGMPIAVAPGGHVLHHHRVGADLRAVADR